MNIQLVIECLGFRTAIAMIGVVMISRLISPRPVVMWARELVLAVTTALAANMLRIQVLYWVSRSYPSAFGIVHDYIGYAAMGVALWLWLSLKETNETNDHD